MTLNGSIKVDLISKGNSPKDRVESRTASLDNDQVNHQYHHKYDPSSVMAGGLSGPDAVDSSMVTLPDMAGQTLFLHGKSIQKKQSVESTEYRGKELNKKGSSGRFTIPSERKDQFQSSGHNNMGANVNVSMLESIGNQDSIIVENSSHRKNDVHNYQSRNTRGQDSLNHMIIKSNMQPHGSSVQITLAESS